MPVYRYHLKFELYPSPDPTHITPAAASTPDIWIPTENSSIFDELPAHPRTWQLKAPSSRPSSKREQHRDYIQGWSAEADQTEEGEEKRHSGPKSESAVVRDSSDDDAEEGTETGGVIDCGASRPNHQNPEDNRNIVRLPDKRSRETSPPPKFTSGIGPRTAAKDWRFGRISIESLDLQRDEHPQGHAQTEAEDKKRKKGKGKDTNNTTAGAGKSAAAKNNKSAMAESQKDHGRSSQPQKNGNGNHVPHGTPAASLGPNLGGMGQATKGRFLPLETKNTEVGWGIVHLYREADESSALRAGLGAGSASGSSDAGTSNGTVNSGDDGTILCITAVPMYMSPSDFLGFIGEKWRDDVSHYRMIMTSKLNRYMVLMKFRDTQRAKDFRVQFDGRPFDSIETEFCHVAYIQSITVESHGTQNGHSTTASNAGGNGSQVDTLPSPSNTLNLRPFPPPTPNLIELPTCTVCLERMDDTAGLMTILCQHVFHCTCLQTWKGFGCPICRATNPKPTAEETDPENPYSRPFGSGPISNLCSVCDEPSDLWICLICGNVGCGRYKGGHAKEHWKETAHSFSLEMETQHVWDYAGDMWVHRMIREKGQGKVVEFPSHHIHNNNTSSERNNTNPPGDRAPAWSSQEQTMAAVAGAPLPHHAPVSEDQEVVPRAKLDSIGLEYTHLLTSQLESQRIYFEEMVAKAADKASKACAAADAASANASRAIKELTDFKEQHFRLKEEVATLERDLARERKRADKSTELARNLSKQLQEEKGVGEGLMKRIKHMEKEAKSTQEELAKLRQQNEELIETNHDLSMFISAQDKLKEMEAEGQVTAEELEEGGMVVIPPEQGSSSRNGNQNGGQQGGGGGGGKKKGKGKGKK
ncbi:hypothetical protein SMACR_07924 [Sordaria macrospora]|uniref:WGS project CABT00000000 data, contig 2.29 n=2 Tax=Sordaria macrospora TaxID=5147 RepID=F7W537_SORMK|nr:uncharacterized protein SMAC_07924 [Sordaria macrospora k-hell]KAA8632113.1 hypothetical protein SMACR_07924 [Sordaria macrospora]WPJ67146.1 hypothetical protein SMAC4_07924 [Sordaria macrospora]CCC12625.1 unnamed protein product [Sordaria macrospora k-hell]